MVRRFFFSIVLLSVSLLVSLSATVRVAKAQIVTKNQFVEADVDQGTGIVTVFNPLIGGHNSSYSFPEKSYFTILVNNTDFFTNNPNLQTQGNPPFPLPKAPAGFLLGAQVTKIADTIETVWQPKGSNAFDIIQDVYPVEFPISNSGQIVFRFRVRNYSKAPVPVQAQYLLDIDLSESGNANDDAPITTRYGYMQTQWTSFNVGSIPPYFIGAINPLSSGSFPGDIISAGYLNDSLAPEPMGLIEPSLFAFVDWREIVTDWTWGVPANPIQFPQIGDGALLIQWPAGAADSSQTTEIGRFSYGAAACGTMCFTAGGLREMMVHPDHIVWNGTSYVPSSFPVEALVWNENTSDTVQNATATQSITNDVSGLAGGPIMVASPSPTSNNGFSQTHTLGTGIVSKLTSASIAWRDTVSANALVHCSNDSLYDIAVNVSATGAGNTACISGQNVCPIMVDCQGSSNDKPISMRLSETGSFDGSICNMRAINSVAFDTGFKKIPVVSITMPTDTNMRLAVAPSHVGADSLFYTVSVIDSMQNGSATVQLTDSIGNTSQEFFQYCTIPDTKWPQIAQWVCIDTVNGPCSVTISDIQPWDRGMDTLYFTNVVNENLTITPFIHGQSSINFEVQNQNPFLPASFCMTAIDLAGHSFDSCFGTLASVPNTSSQPMELKILPNPASSDVTIFVEGIPAANVEIFDVLGHEIAHFTLSGSYDWQLASLSVGTYIVRAASGEQVMTKRVVKE